MLTLIGLPVLIGFLASHAPVMAYVPEGTPALDDESGGQIQSPSPLDSPVRKYLDESSEAAESSLNKAALARFYSQNGFAPVWTSEQNVESVIRTLADARNEGLEPLAYRADLLNERYTALKDDSSDPDKAAAFDVLLTDAFLRYSTDMRIGRISPRQGDGAGNWKLEAPSFDAVVYLQQALQSGNIAQALADLPPPHKEYAALREMLRDFRAQAETTTEWPTVAVNIGKIEPGASNPQIPMLRKRLHLTGELAGDVDLESPVMDDVLVEALKKFQESQGLLVDGVLGKRTIMALNMSPRDRVRQIIANMERWRWVPRQLEPSRIMINISGQWLELFDNDTEIMSMRVIVGTRANKTPTLRSKVVSLTLNPHWTLPYSIASKEVLPKLKKNPNYLAEQEMHIVGGDIEYPEFIDWSQYGQRNFPYTLRQASGPRNPLGRIKFNMPNSDDIYLHDTSNRGMFVRADRALSHGCVRLQKPLDLALYVLRDQSRWNKEKLEKAIGTSETQYVNVKTPVPVYLLYWTAWKDANGVAHFRDDIYDRDRTLLAALGKAVPSVMEN